MAKNVQLKPTPWPPSHTSYGGSCSLAQHIYLGARSAPTKTSPHEVLDGLVISLPLSYSLPILSHGQFKCMHYQKSACFWHKSACKLLGTANYLHHYQKQWAASRHLGSSHNLNRLQSSSLVQMLAHQPSQRCDTLTASSAMPHSC